MNSVIFFILRRMRRPLLVFFCVYSLVVIGMVMMPGVDDKGEPWHMNFFHAVYFVSFMGSTIGFGEIPYPFSDTQRMWVMFSIYLTVIAWLYAIGTVLNLLRDESLRRVIREIQFTRTVRKLNTPFYLICGYGSIGHALVKTLENRGMQVVIIELKQEYLDKLYVEDYPIDVPSLCADSRKPHYLLEGGLKNPHCAAVLAITNDDLVNLQIAITAKLLAPSIPVISRVGNQDIANNMASFGTDFILNPFKIFAASLHTALHCPHLHILREWFMERLLGIQPLAHVPPKSGLWILCGYGRFGKAVYQHLKREANIRIIVVEAKLAQTGYPDVEYVIGNGTEASTLEAAHIQEAVGLVAGTDDDVNNLSIIMTARELSRAMNKRLFIVARQNSTDNKVVFEAADADIVMLSSQTIADYIRVLLTTPMLVDFMKMAKKRGDLWVESLISRIKQLENQELLSEPPSIWELEINASDTPSVFNHLLLAQDVLLIDLLRDPRDRWQNLPCVPLLLRRDTEFFLLPAHYSPLKIGDRLLFCSTQTSHWWMSWMLKEEYVFHYILTGKNRPRGYIGRWLEKF